MSESEQSFQLLERTTRVCALGLRFWDGATQSWVRDGLSVMAFASKHPNKRVRAFASPSGYYAFHDLLGMAEFARGRGDDDFWEQPHRRTPFLVDVVDEEKRFLAIRYEVSAPIRVRESVEPPGSPLDPVSASVPLFSAPSRPVPPGMAAIRADLRDPSGRPAAWAVLEADLPGQPLAVGLADASGRVLVLCPYPEPVDVVVGAPPGGTSPLVEQTWTVGLRGRYRPVQSNGKLPELRHVLDQATAELWADNGSPPQPLSQATLSYGRDLIVRSIDSSSGQPLSHLLIKSAA